MSSSWRPNVVQRVLGRASAAMPMDLYGHLIDRDLWTLPIGSGARWGPSSDEGLEVDSGVAPSIQRCENPTLPSLTRDKPSCMTSSTATGATSPPM